jgi:hypothetical protein
MVDRILNRPSNNYIFTGSRLRAGNNNSDARLRLSTANNESIIDLCNNGNVDISASSVFINGLKVVTTSNGDATSLTSLQLAQNLDVSGLISSDGGIRIGSGVFGGTITKSSTIHEIVIDPFGIDGSTSTSQDLSWIQLGQDIDGEAPTDYFGSAVSINATGTIVAIGATQNAGIGTYSGYVRIYQYNNNANDPSWIQMGQDIDGEAPKDGYGFSVSLNDTGNIVAIGAPYNNENGTYSGHIRIYQYNNNANDPSWIQMGPDINGETTYTYAGHSISLNATGNIVATGGPYNSGNGNHSGHVRVYQYNNNVNDPSWIQMGQDIDGEAPNDNSGYSNSISLNATGNILAIGAPYNDGGGENSGHVRVYQYNNNVNDPSWIKLGPDINGAASNFQAGYVSLNAPGTILAIGAPGIGKVKMYQYNNNANDPSWIQLGPDINGEALNDYSGRYISLNDAGNILAIGAPYNNGINGGYSGHVRVYQYNNNVNDPSWIRIGQDIDGKVSGDYAARVSLNAAGNIVIIGGPYNDGNGDNAGYVRIYKLQEPVSAVTDASGQVVIMGDLVVRGNTTTIYSTNIDISDVLLTLASGSTTTLKSNNAGFRLGDGYASLLYDSSENRWKTNIGLNISGGLTGNSGINFNGNMLPLNNVSRLPVTFNTFACVTLPLRQDLLYGNANANTWMDASGYVVGTQVLSNYSYIKIDLKVAYTSSPEAYQTLGFRVLRGATDGSSINYSSTPVFSDISLGSNTGITSNNIYNGIYYDNLNGALLTNNTLYYKLQFRRDCPSTTTISRPFGIRGSTGNYFAIQELYNLISSNNSNIIIDNPNLIIDYANSTITQFGLDILGEADTTYAGYNVALSEDGTIMAISAPNNNGTGTLRGSTRIYQYNNIDISWVQLGPDIDGEADNDQQTNVKLSKDGTIVAVSSFANSGTGSVRVFKYNAIDISWIKQGQDIDGTGAGDEFAKSFSLSANGKIIAIGATLNDTSYNNAGQVVVYSYNDVSWNKIGTFNGFGPDAMTGESVSLSSSGTILAISSLPPETSSSFPRVNIYELSNNVWSPKGPTIFAPYASNMSGSRYGKIIELSSDGTIIAINDRFQQNTNYGRVLVYKYTSIDNSWNKLGSDVSGAVVTQNASIDPYIALSADGTIMAVGYVSDSTYKGLVRLYKFTNNNWVKIGSDLIGDSTYSYFGISLALSSNGSILAVGNPLNSPSNSGLVRTYNLNYAYINSNLIIDYANSTFSPLGQDLSGELSIEGEPELNFFGYSVALSEDGTIMGITAPLNNGTGTLQGSSRIYKYNDTSWVQLGQDIDGENDFEYQDIIKISSNGTIVAISSPTNSNSRGSVRIFKYTNDTSWVQQGLDIDGTLDDDLFGYSISLSGNGTILAIGAPNNDSSYNNAGQVHVYSYIENINSWNLIRTFNGFGVHCKTGTSVSLSSSGTILAISSPFPNNYSDFAQMPRVDIYELSNNVWSPKGPTIYGSYFGGISKFGTSIVLSRDGLVLAINELYNPSNSNLGRVLVYNYNTTDNSWNKLGSDINIVINSTGKDLWEDPYIALSSDGTIMALGMAPSDSTNRGLVRLYKLINSEWIKVGPDLLGNTSEGLFGSGLSLSSDGTILAVGSPYEDPIATGFVRTYKLNYAYT